MLVENPYCAIQIMHSGIWNCCAVLRLAISKNVRVQQWYQIHVVFILICRWAIYCISVTLVDAGRTIVDIDLQSPLICQMDSLLLWYANRPNTVTIIESVQIHTAQWAILNQKRAKQTNHWNIVIMIPTKHSFDCQSTQNFRLS